MNLPYTPQTPLSSEVLRVALGPGFQLTSATDRVLRQAARKH